MLPDPFQPLNEKPVWKHKIAFTYIATNDKEYIVCRMHTGSLIRLVGGSLYNEGRVEVNYNGEWGTVCNDGWDDTDAGVVCRQLGFGSSGTAIRSAGFGQGSGSIWLDSVTCTGNESTLASCGHLGIGVTRNCSHFSDAGIICIGQFSKKLYHLIMYNNYGYVTLQIFQSEYNT